MYEPNFHHLSYNKTVKMPGPDPRTKAWVGNCVCVMETGLATNHWSGKSEGYICLTYSQYHIVGYFPKVQIFPNFPKGLTTWENLFWKAV